MKNAHETGIALPENIRLKQLNVPELVKLQPYFGLSGCGFLEIDQFRIATAAIQGQLKDPTHFDTFLQKTVNIDPRLKKPGAYLRGGIYYSQLGPNYTGKHEYTDQGFTWQEQFKTSVRALRSLKKDHVSIQSQEQKIVVLSVFDHIKDCLLRLQSTLHNCDEENHAQVEIDTLVEEIVIDYYTLLLANGTSTTIKSKSTVTEQEEKIAWHAQKHKSRFQRGFREADHPINTALFGLSLLNEIRSRGIKINTLCGVREGGAELPYAINAIGAVSEGKRLTDNVVDLYFSGYRNTITSIDEAAMLVPQHQRVLLTEDTGTILVVDNNAKTFKTLDQIKQAIGKSRQCMCAVPQLAYRYIRQNQTSGELAAQWQTVLDFHPISQYISCYAYRGIQNREVRRIADTRDKNGASTENASNDQDNILVLGGDLKVISKRRKVLTQSRRLLANLYEQFGYKLNFVLSEEQYDTATIKSTFQAAGIEEYQKVTHITSRGTEAIESSCNEVKAVVLLPFEDKEEAKIHLAAILKSSIQAPVILYDAVPNYWEQIYEQLSYEEKSNCTYSKGKATSGGTS